MRANSQQVGFYFRHTFIYSLFCNICFISYSQKCAFFAIYSSIRRLQWFQRGWQWPNAGRRGGREDAKEKGERKGERALLASAVHVARAPYMSVTQDVAVGLSCILCTPTLDYPEYHARLRSNILNTKHAYDRLSWIPCASTLEYPEYHTRLRPICLIFYENSK